jgi:hypothetical protein
MAMTKSVPAADPQAYVAALTGWQKRCVQALRAGVVKAAPLEEVIKWRNLVYFSNGPVIVIRAEDKRVLFGFWRGQHLRDIEPRLKPGGKFEMATMEFGETTSLSAAKISKLVKAAVALNALHGDPTKFPVEVA